MNERRAIAFSLYGNQVRYLMGAVRNAQMAADYYPGWEVYFWVGPEVPRGIVGALKSHGAHVHTPPPDVLNGMLWRFLIHDEPEVDRYIVRDVDSRFSMREVRAVNEWIAAGTQLHIMRDHPYHNQAMMGGMWGWMHHPELRFKLINQGFQAWAQKTKWGEDNKFLKGVFWHSDISRTVHDSCGTFDGTQTWPPSGPAFVGEYVDEHEQPNFEHRKARMNFLKGQAA